MPITKTTNVIYTLINATVDGSLTAKFNVNIDGITTFNIDLTIPEVEIASILDVTITDGKTIREALTERICNYAISSGQITGTLTA